MLRKDIKLLDKTVKNIKKDIVEILTNYVILSQDSNKIFNQLLITKYRIGEVKWFWNFKANDVDNALYLLSFRVHQLKYDNKLNLQVIYLRTP